MLRGLITEAFLDHNSVRVVISVGVTASARLESFAGLQDILQPVQSHVDDSRVRHAQKLAHRRDATLSGGTHTE
jgi:hypothetical protein